MPIKITKPEDAEKIANALKKAVKGPRGGLWADLKKTKLKDAK